MFNKLALANQFGGDLKEGEYYLFTRNLRLYKNSVVMVTGNNKAVFLKWGTFCKALNSTSNLDGYIVKMNANTLDKVYTFRHDFEGFCFEKDDTAERLKAIADEQEASEDHLGNRGTIKMFHLENSFERL